MKRGYKALEVYQKSFALAIKVYKLTKRFPEEERYSLTDQIRRSSRSVCLNLVEGYRKRQYPKHFASKMSDSDGECSETKVWLEFAHAFGFISEQELETLTEEYDAVGRILNHMIQNPHKFAPIKKA
jgi:four helix bundle protein